ncbi:HAD family hydrolase [Spirulina sp. CS-785/01]|uniref:HAD family hydrolase n=1 Tax=Spirulina sp. CS-785/01 TaxID=3021716 RepID=UPI00232AB015|nr:HAD family hydrolase [Spirulina sp. CS-785/01]MDB9312389.1 HAD family hydrolase [Spirulina sp. CS-785/01]
MLRLITDFDGPIMDVSERYYRVYLFCLNRVKRPDQEIRVLSKSEFWQLKRSRMLEKDIGRLCGFEEQQAQEFSRLRRQYVHSLPNLVHDHPVEGAREALERIEQTNLDLVVLTMRRCRELEIPLKRHNLEKFFPPSQRYCIADDYQITRDIQDKPKLMAKALAELPPAAEVWMVGDTEADIVAAKNYGIKVISVLSGIRDHARLAPYRPHYIVNTLQEAVEVILEQSLLEQLTINN